jgi:hypothetical protein
MPSKYKRRMSVEVLNYSNEVVRRYSYLAYPVSIKGFNMGTDNGLVMPTIRFKVDELVIEQS